MYLDDLVDDVLDEPLDDFLVNFIVKLGFTFIHCDFTLILGQQYFKFCLFLCLSCEYKLDFLFFECDFVFDFVFDI